MPAGRLKKAILWPIGGQKGGIAFKTGKRRVAGIPKRGKGRLITGPKVEKKLKLGFIWSFFGTF
jgi:hypothetical protein